MHRAGQYSRQSNREKLVAKGEVGGALESLEGEKIGTLIRTAAATYIERENPS